MRLAVDGDGIPLEQVSGRRVGQVHARDDCERSKERSYSVTSVSSG